MGLSVTLSNALSGMKIGQNALDVLSYNVANAGTPGYHKRALSVIETLGVNSTYAREGALSRTFNQSLQQHYTRAVSDSAFASVQSSYLDRVQTLFGMPGTVGSLDDAFNSFETSLTSLSTSPDSFAARADTVQKAQVLASTLNRLTTDIQSLRQEVESRIATSVDDINAQLSSLEKINIRLADQGIDPGSRATLLDQRDRLVSSLSEQMDLRVAYRNDDTVALMTRSGVGILDGRASIFSFESAGALAATSQFSTDDTKSKVGRLMLMTSAGLPIDLVKQNVLASGELAGLVELRDAKLVQAQDQLDEVASALAMSLSTNVTAGTQVTAGLANGFDLDISNVRNGNEFTFSYTQGGIEKAVRVLHVDDTSKMPLDYVDANGARVIGLDFTAGSAAVATELQNRLGAGLVVTSPSSVTIRIVDDGAGGTTDMVSASSRWTSTGLQNGDLAINLFVDFNNADYTNALDGNGQRLGFAGRIQVNTEILADNKLLVQYQATTSLGDAKRVDSLVDNLGSMRFAGSLGTTGQNASFRLAGTVSDFISQAINFQGNAAASAISDADTQELTLNALGERLEGEYGVDVDEEMARLMELQNAFSANARVMSVAQELIDSLMQIVR
ncbi:flagellar hook-associated protein FlgK [Devosia sp.]|uniref:flagellar hook-associated protein FlgK n=1 Tax=Devosia sp. TaxID=1871048 RepID=UPI0035B0F6BF